MHLYDRDHDEPAVAAHTVSEACWPTGRPLHTEGVTPMFAPSINVDLEKLQQASEEKPAPRKTAARGRAAAARKAAAAKSENEKKED